VQPSPQQQEVCHPVSRVRQDGSPPDCRALAVLAILTLLPLPALVTGCGQVHFVPSPYTPQHIELIYSAQEDVTVVRWRVSAAPLTETRFELLGVNGYQAIDFSQSVFAGGLTDCGDGFGTCAQYVVRGHYTVATGAKPIQAVHDVFGVLPGGVPMIETVPPTLAAVSFFHSRNTTVTLNITDTIGGRQGDTYYYPRSFEQTMWPTTGLCVSETPPDGVSFSPLDATGGFPPPTPLTATGTYCVATRPIPLDGGGSTMVQVRIATLPETVTATQIFEPPIERSPIVYQIILDLEIPVPDRCADVIQKIESWTAAYLVGGGVPVRKLPTVNHSANGSSQCAQTSDRTVASVDVADQIKQVIATLTGTQQQIHLMYFNNLDAPLPSPVTTSLQSLFDALANGLPNYELHTHSWMLAPPAAFVGPLQWWAFWPWETADDMFKMMLQDYGQKKLPYTTQWHEDGDPVALLSDDDVNTYQGQWLKICSSSPGIQPIGVQPFRHDINAPAWQITTDDPPSYLVMLKNQKVVAVTDFVEQSARVNYQICTRYCSDHPFVDAAGNPGYSWTDDFTCAVRDE
jgi:hypothetical protein